MHLYRHTGSDGFVYNDSFNYTKEELSRKLNISEEKAERILSFSTKGSASHSAWLTFMACRLIIARDLLTPDGVIFISIDDNEQANLKLLCDSVFGEENMISDSIWHSKYTTSNDSTDVSRQHEHILIYSKNREYATIGLLARTAEMDASYKNPDNDPKGPWKPTPLHAKSGTLSSLYTITFPNGVTWSASDGRYPRYSKERLLEIYNENGLYFNSKGGVDRKTYLSEVKQGKTVGSVWSFEEVGSTHQANEQLAEIMGKGVFDNPKPIGLLERCFFVANLKDADKSIVLDFFSGSASTAQAILCFNSKYRKNHTFIMVQIPAKIEKDRAKFTTIDEIGQERIRRAAKKIREEMEAEIEKKRAEIRKAGEQKKDEEKERELKEMEARLANMDFGFKHFTLRTPSQNTLDRMESFDPNSNTMFNDDIKHAFGIQTILSTWANSDGYGLNANIEAITLDGYTAYLCGKHLYFVDEGLKESDMVRLIELYGNQADFAPQVWVVFGYCFGLSQTEMLRKNAQTVEAGTKNIKVEISIRY